MTVADELAKLAQLHADGALTDEEFNDAKNVVLHPGELEPAGEFEPTGEPVKRRRRLVRSHTVGGHLMAPILIMVATVIMLVVIAWFFA